MSMKKQTQYRPAAGNPKHEALNSKQRHGFKKQTQSCSSVFIRGSLKSVQKHSKSVKKCQNLSKTIKNSHKSVKICLFFAIGGHHTYFIAVETRVTSQYFFRNKGQPPNILLKFLTSEHEGQEDHYALIEC